MDKSGFTKKRAAALCAMSVLTAGAFCGGIDVYKRQHVWAVCAIKLLKERKGGRSRRFCGSVFPLSVFREERRSWTSEFISRRSVSYTHLNKYTVRQSADTETFTCAVCGRTVTSAGAGSLHRNHCPYCLSSVHLDDQPGDRAAECGGIMEIVGVWAVSYTHLKRERTWNSVRSAAQKIRMMRMIVGMALQKSERDVYKRQRGYKKKNTTSPLCPKRFTLRGNFTTKHLNYIRIDGKGNSKRCPVNTRNRNSKK